MSVVAIRESSVMGTTGNESPELQRGHKAVCFAVARMTKPNYVKVKLLGIAAMMMCFWLALFAALGTGFRSEQSRRLIRLAVPHSASECSPNSIMRGSFFWMFSIPSNRLFDFGAAIVSSPGFYFRVTDRPSHERRS